MTTTTLTYRSHVTGQLVTLKRCAMTDPEWDEACRMVAALDVPVWMGEREVGEDEA